MSFQQFEDIEAWRKARELTQAVYAVTDLNAFARDFGLRNQIRRASVSIMSNIAEGYERDGAGEFIQFLAMAKASAGEVRSQLYVAVDRKYITKGVFDQLCDTATQTSRMISGLMHYLRKSRHRGTKYRG